MRCVNRQTEPIITSKTPCLGGTVCTQQGTVDGVASWMHVLLFLKFSFESFGLSSPLLSSLEAWHKGSAVVNLVHDVVV
jgi:hypothetical protein